MNHGRRCLKSRVARVLYPCDSYKSTKRNYLRDESNDQVNGQANMTEKYELQKKNDKFKFSIQSTAVPSKPELEMSESSIMTSSDQSPISKRIKFLT